jgi:signal transduction histidine kinase
MSTASHSDPEAADLAERYLRALAHYVVEGGEEALTDAYEIARSGLAQGMTLGTIVQVHASSLRHCEGSAPSPLGSRDRADQFLLEIASVYDMALQGYEMTMLKLRAEIAERRAVEEQLRAATRELQRQRDALDAQVAERTRDLSDKAHRLQQTLDQLRRTNREQAEFTYAISHDLKSPSTTMSMLLDELALELGETAGREVTDLLDLARQTSFRMGKLVDDVLAYARCVEHTIVREPIDLDNLLREIVVDLHGDVAAAGAQVNIAPLPTVRGSPVQIKLLFRNLIANAVKFCSPDKPPRIEITCTPGRDTARLSVLDNGIGIAPEFHDRIFGLFQRLHSHDEYAGSGVGLALCARIAANHDTRVDVESEPTVGSCFSVTLERVG